MKYNVTFYNKHVDCEKLNEQPLPKSCQPVICTASSVPLDPPGSTMKFLHFLALQFSLCNGYALSFQNLLFIC